MTKKLETAKKRREYLDKLYNKLLIKAGLNKHPKNLSEDDRIMQYRILCQASEIAGWLPIDKAHWEEWFEWHLENKTKYITCLGKE